MAAMNIVSIRPIPDESFNGNFRDEGLRLEWFRNRAEAMAVIEEWRTHYNDVRPHSSLAYKTPTEFKREQQQSTEAITRELVLQ